jgi:outer membrane receptor protein involved in Fe transport
MSDSRHRNFPLLAVAGAALVALASGARAQNAPSASSEGLEEIVVSASRQGTESVQRVPMAISVVSATELENKGLGSVADFGRTIPSVNMQEDSPGVNAIEMRGVVTTGPDITTLQDRSLTSTYLDDAPISIQSANPDLKVFDLERIEVIRGPQGTLYGAGSMSGTIRLITKKPDSHEFSGSFDTALSNTDHGSFNYNVRGLVNLPLIDNVLGVRIAVYRGEDSGFINNLGTHTPRANDVESTQGRVAARWTPNEMATIDASVTFARLTDHGNYNTYPQLGDYTYTSLNPERFDDDFKLYNLTGDFDLGFAHLIASASYQDRQFTDERSFDFFDEALLTPGVLLPSQAFQINSVKDATQEIRLVSRQDQKLRWSVGAFHEQYHRFYPQDVYEPGLDATIASLYGLPGFTSVGEYGTPREDDLFFGTIDVKEHQTALFGEVTYEVVPKVDVTLGARYFDFKQDFNLYFTGIAGALGPGEPLLANGTTTSSGGNPRAVVSFKPTDSLMFFAQAARGFRYGGVNLPVPLSFCAQDLAAAHLTNAPPTFGPDHLWDYDIGEKGTFWNGRIVANVTAFYIDWGDVQTTFPLACGYPFVENQGKVKSRGFELENRAKVTDALTLNLNSSFTDAEANGPLVNLNAPSGSKVPFFPRWIVTTGPDYAVPMGEGSLRLSADYTYRSSTYNEFNLEDPTTRQIPSSTMVNASVTYAIRKYEFSVYGTNLTDNLLVSEVQAGNRLLPYVPGDSRFIGRPRTYGVRFHVGF